MAKAHGSLTRGERMRIWRCHADLSQSEMARRLGVTRQAVNQWEGDVTDPRLDHFERFARECETSVGSLRDSLPTDRRRHLGAQ